MHFFPCHRAEAEDGHAPRIIGVLHAECTEVLEPWLVQAREAPQPISDPPPQASAVCQHLCRSTKLSDPLEANGKCVVSEILASKFYQVTPARPTQSGPGQQLATSALRAPPIHTDLGIPEEGVLRCSTLTSMFTCMIDQLNFHRQLLCIYTLMRATFPGRSNFPIFPVSILATNCST